MTSWSGSEVMAVMAALVDEGVVPGRGWMHAALMQVGRVCAAGCPVS